MKNIHIPAALLLSAALLGACNQYTFNREAGDMDNGDFGNATMQNSLLANGQIQAPMGYDKYDAPTGRLLSGKYAAGVIAKYSGCACGGETTAATTTTAAPAETPAAPATN